MSDKITYQASMAQDLLDNEVLNDALARMESALFEEMLEFAPEDDTGRRLNTERVRTVREFKSRLKRYLLAKAIQDKQTNSAKTTA